MFQIFIFDLYDPVFIRPLVARIDAYEPWRYLIDITLDIPISSFNQTSIKNLFLKNLRKLLYAWVVQIQSYQLEKDR